jgi:hypothetical protein
MSSEPLAAATRFRPVRSPQPELKALSSPLWGTFHFGS